jgi:hypothetical protein
MPVVPSQPDQSPYIGGVVGTATLPVRVVRPVYAVGGTLLADQPYLTTAPAPSPGATTISAGTPFTLFFQSPTSGTQTLLANGNTVTLTFGLADGRRATGRVRVLNSLQTIQHILVPDYVYPTVSPGWDRYEAGYPTCTILIANPSNGPGVSVNSDYTTAINAARAAGIKVIGYVHTHYADGTILLATVEADVDTWYSLYTIDGIFVDEVAADIAHLGYYTSLSTYIKGKDVTRNFVAMNPGVVPYEGYVNITDTISVFENSYAAWLTNWASGAGSAQFLLDYSPSHWWALVYGIPDNNSMATVVQAMKDRNVGYVFVTDQGGYTAPPSASFWTGTQNAINSSGIFQVQCTLLSPVSL